MYFSDNVPIILADVKDEESLKKMTEQAKVIANCIGPYRFYGEPVIKACLDTRTHYIDISGETQVIQPVVVYFNEDCKDYSRICITFIFIF